MTWQYNIEWHGNGAAGGSGSSAGLLGLGSNGLRKSIVVVTSKPRSQLEDSLITVSAWTKNDTSG